MTMNRRNFVRIAGLGAIGAVAGELIPPGKAFASEADATTGASSFHPDRLNPITGTRWAMVVDCRVATHDNVHAAMHACHQDHNVPQIDSAKEEIKWIWEEHFSHAFHEQDLHHLPEEVAETPTLLLCNHCDNPPCTKVCPTEATWRRESDGIVMMDWHRCIGCRYCVVACPYGSRSFNFRDPRPYVHDPNPYFPTRMRGVVEKCTFCEERLAVGEMPACVDATKDSGLLTFGDLDDPNSRVSELLREHFSIRRKPGLGTQPMVFYIVPRKKVQEQVEMDHSPMNATGGAEG